MVGLEAIQNNPKICLDQSTLLPHLKSLLTTTMNTHVKQ